MSEVAIHILLLISRVTTGNLVYNDCHIVIGWHHLVFERSYLHQVYHVLIVGLDLVFQTQIPKFSFHLVSLFLFVNLFEVSKHALDILLVLAASNCGLLGDFNISKNLLLFVDVEAETVVLKQIQEFTLWQHIVRGLFIRNLKRRLPRDAAPLSESLEDWSNVLTELHEVDFEVFIVVQTAKNSVNRSVINIWVILRHEIMKLIEVNEPILPRIKR